MAVHAGSVFEQRRYIGSDESSKDFESEGLVEAVTLIKDLEVCS